MNEGNHIVKSKVFEVSFNLEKEGLDFQKRLSQLIKHDLSGITEKCLSHFDSPVTHYIHRIELNLRDIPYEDFEQILPQLYEEKLMSALSERLNKNLKSSDEQQEKADEQNAITIIRYFLIKGYMPWNFNDANWNSFNDLFDYAFTRFEQDLLEELNLLLKSAPARIRLVNHINDRSIKELIKKVEPAQAELIISYHKDWIDIQKKKPVFKSSENELSKRFWLFILNYLYEERGSYFNTKSFLLSTLRQVASHFNVSFEFAVALLQQSYEAEAKSGARGTFHNLIGDILKEYHLQEDTGLRTQKEQKENKREYLTFEELNQYLLRGEWNSSKSKSDELIEKSLWYYLKEDPPSVIQMLKALTRSVQSVYNFIEPLSEPVIHGIVALLSPGDEKVIINYHKQVVHLQEKKRIIRSSSRNFPKLVWSIIITILADNHGSYFNHKSFVRSLIQRVGQQHNLAYKSLLLALWQSLKLMKSDPSYTGLVKLIADIQKEDFGEANSQETEAKPLEALDKQWIYLSIKTGSLHKEISKEGYKSLPEFLELYAEVNQKVFFELLKQHKSEEGFVQRLSKQLNTRLFIQLVKGSTISESRSWQRMFEVVEGMAALEILNPVPHQKAIKEFTLKWVLGSFPTSKHSIEREIMSLASKHGMDFNALMKSFLWIANETNNKELAEPLRWIADKYKIQVADKSTSQKEKRPDEKDPDKLDAAMVDQLVTILLSGIHGIFDRRAAISLGFKSVDEVLTFLRKNRPDRLRKSMGSLLMESHPFVGIGREIPLTSFYALLTTLNSGEGRSLVNLLRMLEVELRGSSQAINRFLSAVRSLALVNLSRRMFNLNHFLEEFTALILSTAPSIYIQVIPVLTRNLSSLSLPSKGNASSAIYQLEQHLSHMIDLRSPMDKESLKRVIEQEYFEKQLKKESSVIPYFEETADVVYDEIYIDNAGLVIANSYIPILFERFGLIKSGKFLSSDHQQKAALLLQYIMLDRPPMDEHHLPFNKLLCGLPLDAPIQTTLEPTQEEMKMVHGLIQAVIQHWTAIGKSSIEGFRGSWLWRKGKLEHKEENWVLRVEQSSYDILLDRIPFSLSPIKYSWMNKPIIVEWR